MSSDVFILSAARKPAASSAIKEALEIAGLDAARVEDAVFGVESSLPQPNRDAETAAAGLLCSAALVSPGLRAVFFAAASILADEAAVSVVVLPAAASASAFLLASPEAVGRLNLLPQSRIAARSLGGAEAALGEAGLAATDSGICMAEGAGMLGALLAELETRPARWGLLTAGSLALLVERL